MLSQTAEDYSKYVDIDLNKKLQPITQTVDEMLLRLEEFEAMIALVQQERCNAIGLTGTLSETIDNKGELMALCKKIDAVEKLVEHIKSNITSLENKVEVAENQFGITDNTAKLKNFFLPLFKKVPETKPPSVEEERQIFTTEKYFTSDPSTE